MIWLRNRNAAHISIRSIKIEIIQPNAAPPTGAAGDGKTGAALSVGEATSPAIGFTGPTLGETGLLSGVNAENADAATTACDPAAAGGGAIGFGSAASDWNDASTRGAAGRHSWPQRAQRIIGRDKAASGTS